LLLDRFFVLALFCFLLYRPIDPDHDNTPHTHNRHHHPQKSRSVSEQVFNRLANAVRLTARYY
jgi:hypothetical protein